MGCSHLQPSHECAEEVANICSELREAYGHGAGSPYLHPLSLLGSTSPSSVMFLLPSQGPLDFPGATPVEVHPPPSRPFLFEEPLALPAVDFH